ncbi:DUF6266 family protein [Flavobacterium agricola]|uniref:DUF6266 family protein n=1 Tax=Flavobacterium agricola TaxID=2870839 RepID=A0ABY6M195_9FLAO|nr:DUF6266 family protein [Flavobacterium agricola]UYW02279.1 DUF6266 family protein [Flavobacterium agricola]
MATYNKGILGPFTGTVGTVVGANWRGKNVMRSLPKKTGNTPTPAQLVQRERFAVVSKFLTPLRPLLNRYFGTSTGVQSNFNLATSYHIKEACLVQNNTPTMVYNKVLITKGELQGLQEATLTTNNKLLFTWADNSGQGQALATDTLLVVIYAPDLHLFEVFETQTTRQAKKATLTAEAYFTGVPIHIWATFVNSTKKTAAVSQYLGTVILN